MSSASGSSSSSLSTPLLNRAPTRPLAIGMRPYGDASLVSSGAPEIPSTPQKKYAPLPDRNPAPYSYVQNGEQKPIPSPAPQSQSSAAPVVNIGIASAPVPAPIPAPAPAPVAAPAPVRGPVQASGGARPSGWSCPVCTFVNEPSRSHCSMCSSALVKNAAPSLPPRPSASSSAGHARVPQPAPQSRSSPQPQVVYGGRPVAAPSSQLRPASSCSSGTTVYASGPVPTTSQQVVYVVQQPRVIVVEAYPCYNCGTAYALPYGATSWRCKCGQFNSLTGDGCNIM